MGLKCSDLLFILFIVFMPLLLLLLLLLRADRRRTSSPSAPCLLSGASPENKLTLLLRFFSFRVFKKASPNGKVSVLGPAPPPPAAPF